MYAKFGTAGCCEAFYDAGGKSALEMPKWLSEHNLDCFEYQCGRGVKISEDAARLLGKNAAAHGISFDLVRKRTAADVCRLYAGQEGAAGNRALLLALRNRGGIGTRFNGTLVLDRLFDYRILVQLQRVALLELDALAVSGLVHTLCLFRIFWVNFRNDTL